jgi:hypothetical protein
LTMHVNRYGLAYRISFPMVFRSKNQGVWADKLRGEYT